MGDPVFANGQEVSGKATKHKVMASMPDVCMSPPSPPAGPVPIPYPNFAKASDTTDGSKKVKINGKEVGLKGKSKYKKSNGDEAATRSFGAGVISHSITGPVKHKAGSFDVKVESCGVVRFMDLTTGNHSNPGDGCMTIDQAAAAQAPHPQCEEMHKENKNERGRLAEAGQKRDPSTPHKTVQEAATGNTTISNATFSGEGMKAASKAVIHKYDNSFAKGLTAEEIEANTTADGKKVKSNACGGHEYQKTARPHTSHTEARIIEEIFKAKPKPTGGTLVLAIDWPGGPAQGKRTSDPCKHCKKLICAVSKPEPGCLDIFICNDKNVPEKPDCPKKKPK